MSKGSKKRKGKVPACAGQPAGATGRQVWLVMTDKDSPEQDALRVAVEQEARAQEWDLRIRRSALQRVLGGQDRDRPYRTLAPRDARDVYQAAHLRPCLVLATHSCYVRADPSHDPATLRQLIGLARFVQYKCCYALVRGAAQARATVAGFTWPPRAACQDHHDPRALPLHVFDPAVEWTELDRRAGDRAAFDRQYSLRSGSRIDSGGHVWEQPSARHGAAGPDRAELAVAGTRLPQGYHWDVQRGRGSGRIVSESAVWLLKRQNAYINAYPNGHLRGEKAHGARSVWS